MKTKYSVTRFDCPVFNEKAINEYDKNYGEDGEKFVRCLEYSPREVAVISRLTAFLYTKLKERGITHGHD